MHKVNRLNWNIPRQYMYYLVVDTRSDRNLFFSILEVYNKQRNDDAILNSAMTDEERIKQQHYLSEEKVRTYIDLCLIKGQSNI